MKKRQYARKPAPDTSVMSAGNLLQTRPFQADSINQQTPQIQKESETLTGGFDLTKQYLFNPPTTVSGQPLQAKLTIGEPNDKYEQEADRVAHDVVQRIHSAQTAEASPPTLAQRQDETVQMKPLLQKKKVLEGGEASSDLESSINQARGSGQSLDANLQRQMGQAMGADFGHVKVHTDTQADQLNQSIQAKAFTTGQDLFFRKGEYQPKKQAGQELIAHELTHVMQQDSGSVQRSTQSEEADQTLIPWSQGATLQRQTGEMIQDDVRLKKGTKVKVLKNAGDRFRVEVIETGQTCWINGRLDQFFKEDSSEKVVSNSIVVDSTEISVKEKPKDKKSEEIIGTESILDKSPSTQDVIVDGMSESQSSIKTKVKGKEKTNIEEKESESSDVLPPPKLGEEVELKVNPKPTLAEPIAGKKVFQSGGGETLKVDVTRKDGKEKINLKAGQDYLNDELSAIYYTNESEIKSGEVTYGALFGSFVLGDGHHRFLWLAHHGKPIKAHVKRCAGGQAWSEMKYQPDPKKPKKAYLQDSKTPALDIESANLDSNEVAKKLRSKWEEINWGELKKPGLVFSTEDNELTTTAQYNSENHTIKLNKDETDPVKLWDNVLFEAQNALNAKIFDELGEEKGLKSDTTFQEYGKKMATVEYDSVKRYVAALRELIDGGLAKESLTTLAQNNLAKWDKWDQMSMEEKQRIETFNNTPHDADATDTKGALSSAELYAYEAVESSSEKAIGGKINLILAEIFSGKAKNQYWMRDQFSQLKRKLLSGITSWPKKSGAARIIRYHEWLTELNNMAMSIQDKLGDSGVNGKTLQQFKEQFIQKIDGADLSPKCIEIAKKLAEK